jgi:hypothetical protein
MPKSRVRKKKGKPVKYTPKPQGISKTKMKQLMELIAKQQELMQAQSTETPELREGSQGELIIGSEFTKKLNVNSSTEILEGPGLSDIKEEVKESETQSEEILEISQDVSEEGPVSGGVE